MTSQQAITGPAQGIEVQPGAADRIADLAASLGHDIVEIGGSLDQIDAQAAAQVGLMDELRDRARQVHDCSADMLEQMGQVTGASARALEVVGTSLDQIAATGTRSRDVTEWVQGLAGRMSGISGVLDGMTQANRQIAEIARQVNILSINAKIVAAQAGESGRGFSVVADEIGALSNRTSSTAAAISDNLASLSAQIETMEKEATRISHEATAVLTEGEATDRALSDISRSVGQAADAATQVTERAQDQARAADAFFPAFERIESGTRETGGLIHAARDRTVSLIDTSERLVQGTVALGGVSADGPFIERVMGIAASISRTFEAAIASGEITVRDLFDSRYRAIPGTDPEQVLAAFTAFTDKVLPPIQEPVLDLDPRIVFCAAVDRHGYLPTHNRKFSKPQGADPVWNTANSRNRRIFDDRVGLKAGRNTAPFLLQVYRRDMGGGEFVMMKDLSAPITVAGRHWGGLRLAYKF